jgi:hypothetical protein
MKLKHVYLLIAILGTFIPLYQFWEFIGMYGFNLGLFFEQMFANDIASFFAWDVIISTIALIIFILVEGSRLKMKNTWVYILLNVLIGVSLALPAFLYMRQIRMKIES